MGGCGTPVPGGGIVKFQVLPAAQLSSATEDDMKKQEPIDKKCQTCGL